MLKAVCLGLTAASLMIAPASALVRGKPVHGLSLYGEPKYGPDFKHFDYVNPNAPKGGTIRQDSFGTFDSFNPFIVKGTPAAGLTYLGDASYFVEGLTMSGADEPFTYYCLLCQTMEVAEDLSWIEYAIRPEARFHDGSPVTADDVVFSFNTLMEKGSPTYKLYWGDVDRVEKTGPLKARFYFKVTDNKELPLITGQLPVISKAYWEKRDFAEASLDIPVSTGPYKIDKFEPGRFITYRRDPNYWGRNLPVTIGTNNFDELRIEFFRDDEVAFEAFKGGAFDLFVENTASRWATGYDENQIKDERVIKSMFRDGMPDSPQLFVLNLRRDKFADRRTRQAIGLAFDFEWSNKTLAYGQYEAARSYFQGAELASSGVPTGEELAILERYRDKVPPEVFTTPYAPPKTDGSGNARENLLKARQLLTDAGWTNKGGGLVNAKGEPLEIEFLTAQQGIEKWFTPYIQNLARLGIKGSIRLIDRTQYINRVTNYDFDLVLGGPAQSISPGNEQREFWGSAAAGSPGGRNWSGIKDPVVDAIIEELVTAQTRESLIAHTRALDRVLLWNYYTIPQLAVPFVRYAYWNKFGMPEKIPMRGVSVDNWWIDPDKAAALESGRSMTAK
ncbi:MAG: ABC transporter substrate-binding protein [Alphaproteobacteria bacterium]|nr:ABC transporter substrate-binding protein [Alphaproteobacteria bacterium]